MTDKKANGQYTSLNTANSLVQQASRDTLKSLAKWRLVEMVVEKRDDTVTDGPAEVKVQTLGRGRGQGANGNFN